MTNSQNGHRVARREHVFARYADVVEALADPALVPLPPSESPDTAAAPGTAAWLRAHVARFAHGPTHARRRAVIEAELGRLAPDRLRRAARAEAAATASADPDPRMLAARVLARELGLADPAGAARDAAAVSAVYFGGDSPEADAAVARLAAAFRAAVTGHRSAGGPDGAGDDEAVANRISILIQAFEATGSLVERARRAPAAPDADVDAVVLETLRHDPPVAAMRRTALRATRLAGVEIAAGDLVVLDIAAANRDPDVFVRPDTYAPGRTESRPLTFGSEPRVCPGGEHALALAAGLLAAGLLAAGRPAPAGAAETAARPDSDPLLDPLLQKGRDR